MWDGSNQRRQINLSGRSGQSESSLSRDEFVKRKKKERLQREQQRLEQDSSRHIQRIWRGCRVRRRLRREVREHFDKQFGDIERVRTVVASMPPQAAEKFRDTVVVTLTRMINLFFCIRDDARDSDRLRRLLQLHQKIRLDTLQSQVRMRALLTLALRFAMDFVLPFIEGASQWSIFAPSLPQDAVQHFVCTVNDHKAWVLFFPSEKAAQGTYISWHVQTENTDVAWSIQAIQTLNLLPPDDKPPTPEAALRVLNNLVHPSRIAPLISWLVWAKKACPAGVPIDKLETTECIKACVDHGIETILQIFFSDAHAADVSQRVLQTIAFSTPFLDHCLPEIPRRTADEWQRSEEGRLFLLAFTMVFLTILAVMDDSEFRTKWVTVDLLQSIPILQRLNYLLILSQPDIKLTLKLSELSRALFDRHMREPLIADWVRPEFYAKPTDEQFRHLLRQIPFTVPFQSRVQHLTDLIHADRETRAEMRGAWFNVNKFRVRREYILEDGFSLFERLNDNNSLRDVLRIEFVGCDGNVESGIDGGGLFKEFLIHLCRTAFSPEFGLFSCTHDNRLVPNPNAKHHHENYLHLFHFLGKVVAKAIYEMVLLEPQLGHTFLNSVLGKVNSLEDLKHLDMDLARNLGALKDMDVNDLGLTFSITNSVMGQAEEIDLIPDGRNIPVTNENKLRYKISVANFRTNVECKKEMAAFAQGLQKAVDLNWLAMFNPHEMNVIISGTSAGFEVKDLREHTVYSGGFDEDSEVIQWVWKLLAAETSEFRSNFLMFSTSCSRTPLLGFKSLNPKFCMHRVPDNDRLPSASTCANLLKLPDYTTEQRLIDKLTQAVYSQAGFDLS